MDISLWQDNLWFVTVILVLFTTALVITAGRSRSQSPLRLLPPGPPGLPIIGNLTDLLHKKQCKTTDYIFFKRFKEYGAIYKLKFGPQMVYVLCDPDYVKEAFTHSKVQGRTTSIGYKLGIGPGASGFIFTSGSEWKTISRFTKDLFREIGVGKQLFSRNILVEVTCFVNRIDSLAEKPCWDLPELFHTATGSVACSIVFGHQYEYGDKELLKLLYFVMKVPEVCGPGGIVFTSNFLCGLPFGPGKRLVTLMKNYRNILEVAINRTRSVPTTTESLTCFVKLFEEKMEKGEIHFNEDNLIACCVDLLGAGTETTSTTLLWIMLCLTTHPTVQEECRRELDDFVGEHGMPTFADRIKLPYLQASILEAERIASVVTLGLPHEIEEDIQLFGYDFPKGTNVVCYSESINMDPNRFPDPHEYRPERYIDDGAFKPNPVIIPFSIGRRSCPGEPLARMEIFLFLTTLLRRFTFNPPSGVKMPSITEAEYGVNRTPCSYGVVFKKRDNP